MDFILSFIKNNTTMKQTAVEWLAEKLIHAEPNILEWDKYIKQAKQMEKEQIINAHKEGNKYNGWALQHEHEQYYNETFNK